MAKEAKEKEEAKQRQEERDLEEADRKKKQAGELNRLLDERSEQKLAP